MPRSTRFTNQQEIARAINASKSPVPGKLGVGKNILSRSQYGESRLKKSGEDNWLGGSFRNVGFSPDGTAVPNEYKVKVKSFRHKTSVVGLIQEGIQLSADSIWETFIPTQITDEADTLIQAVSGGKWSLVTKATSRRKWRGSTPLEINVPMRFEAVADAYKEVVEPCRVLQSLVLPSEGQASETLRKLTGYKKPLPILAPPGPTPFTLNTEGVMGANRNTIQNIPKEQFLEGVKGGDFIIVEFGRFLSFYNVIVKRALVEYAPKFDQLGNPISAKVNMTFETYEILTAEALGNSYEKKALSSTSVQGF